MRTAVLILLLVVDTASYGSVERIQATAEFTEAIRNFLPTESDASIYSIFVQSANSEAKRRGGCSVNYTAAVLENIHGPSAKEIEFCSDYSLDVGSRYLVAIAPLDLGHFSEESAKRLKRLLPDHVLVRHWFFAIYDIHLDDGSTREVVKVPEPLFHAPKALVHAQVSNCQEDDFYKAMYNVIYWDELLEAMKLSFYEN